VSTFEGLRSELVGLQKVEGITPVDILLLPEAIQRAVRRMLRSALTSQELAEELRLPAGEAQQLADILVDKGFLQVQARADGAGVAYKVYFARMHRHDIPLEL
jgi:hypothetical protein